MKQKRFNKMIFLFYLIIGILLMLLPLIYSQDSYDDLLEKDIVVQNVGYKPRRNSSPNYFLITTDGETLHIRGDLSFEELKETLQPNTEVTVKYYEGRYFFKRTEYIKELTCDGTQLVTYNGNDQPTNQIMMILVGLLVIAAGAAKSRVNEPDASATQQQSQDSGKKTEE